MPLSMLISILILMLVLSAFFSGSETALMTLNRYRLRHLVKLKHTSAIKAQHLLNRPDRLLGLILLCNNFVNNFASSIATIIAIKLYAGEESSVAIAAVILTIVMLVFSEVTPKTLSAIKPELLAFPAAWIYTPLLQVFYPVVWFVNIFVNYLLHLFGVDIKNSTQDSTLSKEELKALLLKQKV